MKRRPTEWKDVSASDTSDKGLISKIYKELNKTQHQENKKSN